MTTAAEKPDLLAKLETFRTPLAELLALLTEIDNTPSVVGVPAPAMTSLREAADAVRISKATLFDAQDCVADAKAGLDSLAAQGADDGTMDAAADAVARAERAAVVAQSRLRATYA